METLIFGGSFNPPTRSHEKVIRAGLATGKFDEAWIMPCAQRRDKRHDIDEIHRLRMVELMIGEVFESDPRVVVSRFELDDVDRPTQTWRTTKALNEHFPDRHFTFVFGADSYIDMPNWEQGERLRSELSMLVVPRGSLKFSVSGLCQVLAVDTERISSTEVRNAVKHGQPIGSFVCGSVLEYITKNNLYRDLNQM